MAQIEATYSALVRALGFTSDEARRRSQILADLVLAEWSAIARTKLNTSRAAYLRSLQVRNVTAHGFICGLPASPSTAVLAHMVEQGMGGGGIGTSGPYDVRKFLLRESTRNIRRTKAGELYLRVPFHHSKKETVAKYGAKIGRAMQRLRATTTDANKRTRYGGRLPPNMVPKLKQHHVSDPLAGMVRKSSTYSRRGGQPVQQTSGYQTWRTASYANTRPDAWISKGIQARRIADDVMREMPALIRMVY
tara:strand:- start:3519 stop:4265 length:747 start_codon:yes stop_codon:yes gene_type:complete